MLAYNAGPGVRDLLWVGFRILLFVVLFANSVFADWNSGVTLEDASTRIAINVVDEGVTVTVDLAENAILRLQGDSLGISRSQLIDEFAKKAIKIRVEQELIPVLKPVESDSSRVVFFSFKTRPEKIEIAPDFKSIEKAGGKHLITVAHQGLPVIDHGVLTSAETLVLDWQDPWYSHFQNPKLKRGHSDPVMAFLYIEPRQLKTEIVVRVKEMAGWTNLGLRDEVMIFPDEFAAVKEKIAKFLLAKNRLTADSQELTPVLERVDFIRMGAADIQAYQPEQAQRQAATLVGVSIVHQAQAIPNKIQWHWQLFNSKIQSVAIRAYDPAGLFDSYVTPDHPVFEWENMLADIDLPSLESKPDSEPVPVDEARQVSKIFWLIGGVVSFLIFIALGYKYVGSKYRQFILPIVLLFGLMGGYFLLKSGRPVFGVEASLGEQRAKTVLQQLLWNIYQAFESSQEDAAYDQLAYSVSGDLQETLYLQNRQSFMVADGALSDVKRIEIQKLSNISPVFSGDYLFDCNWLVVGEVIHWGHQHRRENVYNAKIKLSPIDGLWKIVAIEPIAQQRVDDSEN